MAKRKRKIDEVEVLQLANTNDQITLAKKFKVSEKSIKKIIADWTPCVRITQQPLSPVNPLEISSSADSPLLLPKKRFRIQRLSDEDDDNISKLASSLEKDPYEYTYIESPPKDLLDEIFSPFSESGDDNALDLPKKKRVRIQRISNEDKDYISQLASSPENGACKYISIDKYSTKESSVSATKKHFRKTDEDEKFKIPSNHGN